MAGTAEPIERILNAGQPGIWCLAPVGSGAAATVWAGTQSGPLLRYAVGSRELLSESNKHAGRVTRLDPTPLLAARLLQRLAPPARD